MLSLYLPASSHAPLLLLGGGSKHLFLIVFLFSHALDKSASDKAPLGQTVGVRVRQWFAKMIPEK